MCSIEPGSRALGRDIGTFSDAILPKRGSHEPGIVEAIPMLQLDEDFTYYNAKSVLCFGIKSKQSVS